MTIRSTGRTLHRIAAGVQIEYGRDDGSAGVWCGEDLVELPGQGRPQHCPRKPGHSELLPRLARPF
jgi:hypothetical protein